MKLKLLNLLYLLLLTCLSGFGQSYKRVTGNVRNIKTSKPLAFAPISLKNHSIGTVTNEDGAFRFLFPENITNDTLLVNYVGYEQYAIAVSSIQQTINVGMLPKAVEID